MSSSLEIPDIIYAADFSVLVELLENDMIADDGRIMAKEFFT